MWHHGTMVKNAKSRGAKKASGDQMATGFLASEDLLYLPPLWHLFHHLVLAS